MNLICVSIGTLERANDFCEENEFPKDVLYADAENVAYDALKLNCGLKETLFDQSTPYSIFDRVKTGKIGELTSVLMRWKPWIPPKREQGFNQGGTFVFKTTNRDSDENSTYTCVYDWYDPATGAHAPANEILKACEID